MTKRRWIASLAGTLCALSLVPASAGDRKSKEKPKPAAPVDLVWPGPPEKPRIRFLAQISAAEDVTGKAKRSFVEKLAGTSPDREQLRLAKPYGVTVDKDGRIFVADPAQRAILIFDRDARTATRWKGNAQFPLSLPIGLAFDREGRLFVSDSFKAQIVVFDPAGKAVAGFGKGVFKRPGGLAIDTQRGRLYVVDAKLNRVFFFDLKTFKLLKSIRGQTGSAVPEEGGFAGPTNIALDSTGRLYVTDTFNCRIQVFDPEGRFVRAFGTQGARPGNFVRPKGIAIDSEGHVYVADAGFNNFQVLTPEGKPLLFVGAAGEQPGEFLLPAGMAIDRSDRIYVTEQRVTGGRLQVFQYLSEKAPPPSDKKPN